MSQLKSSSTTIKIPVKKTILIGIAAIVIAILIVAAVLFLYLNRPLPYPVVVSQNERQEEHQLIVDAGVRNDGADGWVTVHAQLELSNQVEVKDTRLYLENGKFKLLTFTFSVAFEQGSSGQVIKTTVWAQSD